MAEGTVTHELPRQNHAISLVPAEIFFEVFSHLDPAATYKTAIADLEPDPTTIRHSTLKSTALVCRHFYRHIFPFLFENVYVCRHHTRRNKAPLNFLAFFRSIVKGDERARTLATYVKRCAIVAYNVDRIREPASSPKFQELSIISKAVAYMSGLQELYLWRTSITSDLIASARLLPPLKLLRLEAHCDIHKPWELAQFRDFPPLQVARAVVNGGSFFDPKTVEGQVLIGLWLSGVERLICDNIHNTFCHALEFLHPMTSLQYLHINSVIVDGQHPETLSNALAALKSLKSLHITSINYGLRRFALNLTEDPFAFEPCVTFPKLPLLEHIHAPVPALQAIIPDSLISSIGISSESIGFSSRFPVSYPSDTSFWERCARVFNKSQHSITTLDIPLAFYKNVLVAELFPYLRYLTIRPAHLNWHLTDIDPAGLWHGPIMPAFWEEPELMIEALLDAWDIHPRVSKLEFVYDRNQIPNEPPLISVPDETLKHLKAMIPSLKVVLFTLEGSSRYTQHIVISQDMGNNESSNAL